MATEFEEMGAVPSFTVTLFVRRYNPEDGQEARWEDFDVLVHGTDRVLDALHKIKWEMDGSLTFRRNHRWNSRNRNIGRDCLA